MRPGCAAARVLLALALAAALLAVGRWRCSRCAMSIRPTTAFIERARVVTSWFDEDPRPFNLQREWRDLAQISPQLQLAVIAAEDQRFPEHSGFDFKQIRKALDEAENGGRPRGASTISQQVAKNLFLWNGRSWVRKGMEAWFTMLIEWTVAQAAHPGDVPQHRRVRPRHLWRRGRRPGVLQQERGKTQQAGSRTPGCRPAQSDQRTAPRSPARTCSAGSGRSRGR